MSDEKVAFDSWLIIMAERAFIGRVTDHESTSILALCPCYELIDNKIAAEGPRGMRILNLVEVQPIAGCVFDVPVYFGAQNRYTTIDVDHLADRDKNELRSKIERLREALKVERAKRSGIHLVGADEVPDLQKH